MKHNYTKMMAAALLAGTAASPLAALADNDETKVVREAVIYTYGDMMYGGDDLQSSVVSLYDSNNRLVRKLELDPTGVLKTFSTFNYNADGLLTFRYNQNYQLLFADRYGLSDPTNTTEYEYDEKGNLICEKGPSETYKYEYDADGNITKKERYEFDYWTNTTSLVQTFVYSDFLPHTINCPQRCISSSETHASYNYVVMMEYNDNCDLLKEMQYSLDDNGGGTYSNSTIYTYSENGQLKSKVRYQMTDIWDYETWTQIGSEDLPVDSVVYTPLDEYREKMETYSYYSYNEDEPWSKSPSYTILEAREFDGSLVPGIKVETLEDKVNTNKVTLEVPDNMPSDYVYDLYCDGVKVATLTKDVNVYVDESQVNGLHEYFAQTVTKSEGGEGLNVSDIVTVENNVNLPAPTNVRGLDKGKTDDEYPTTCMTVAWDAPKDVEGLGFLGYNVFASSEYYDSQENDEALTDTKFTVNMYNYYTEKNLYVQAMYLYGTSNSDTVLIKMDDLPDATSIEGVNTVAGKVAYSNNTVTTAKAAKISVMDASGKKVGEADNATSLSLDNMPSGIYVVSVQCDGKLSVVKVRK